MSIDSKLRSVELVTLLARRRWRLIAETIGHPAVTFDELDDASRNKLIDHVLEDANIILDWLNETKNEPVPLTIVENDGE